MLGRERLALLEARFQPAEATSCHRPEIGSKMHLYGR